MNKSPAIKRMYLLLCLLLSCFLISCGKSGDNTAAPLATQMPEPSFAASQTPAPTLTPDSATPAAPTQTPNPTRAVITTQTPSPSPTDTLETAAVSVEPSSAPTFEPAEDFTAFPKSFGDIVSDENITVEPVYYDGFTSKFGIQNTDEVLRNTISADFKGDTGHAQMTSFLNDYLTGRGIYKKNPDWTSYLYDGTRKIEYYVDNDSKKICFCMYSYGSESADGVDNITCVTVNASDLYKIGNLTSEYDQEQNIYSEAFYNADGVRDAGLTYKYYTDIPFPVALNYDYENADDYDINDILVRNERFLLYNEYAGFDDNDKLIGYNVCLRDKMSPGNHDSELSFDSEGRLDNIKENLLADDNEFGDDWYFKTNNYSAKITIDYRETDYPRTVDYEFSEVSHGTYDSSGTAYYDTEGRMVYRNFYMTSGDCSVYYIYQGESRKPWAIVSYGGIPYSIEDGYKYGMDTSVYLFKDFNDIPENTNVVRRDYLYAPIINAYAELEKSGFATYDEDLIGDSLLTQSGGSTYNFGWYSPPMLTYAYYDINADGSPELLIGAGDFISGIYTLIDDKLVSVIQVVDRHSLALSSDDSGDCVISHSWDHMGDSESFFYRIDENGQLITLDKLYTDIYYSGDDFVRFRSREIDGERVKITEEEYSDIMRKYYGGETKYIQLDWNPILAYKS